MSKINIQPRFGIERERQNHLFYKEYKNDNGMFHFHSQIELYFVDEGEMEILVNHTRRTVRGGEMSVALSFTPHGYKTSESSRSSVLIIPPYLCEEFMCAIRGKRVTSPYITDKAAVKKIKDCIKELNSPDINPVKLRGYLYVILGIVFESLSFKNADEEIDTELSSKLMLYLNENFRNEITLSVLSAEFGFSSCHISRYFKACFNIGINQYLTVIRLKNALMLMQEGNYTLTRCALESGFNSMRTFYRVFLKEFDCSPKEYLANLPQGTFIHANSSAYTVNTVSVKL